MLAVFFVVHLLQQSWDGVTFFSMVPSTHAVQQRGSAHSDWTECLSSHESHAAAAGEEEGAEQEV